jgi:hypothetical protein
MPLHWRPVVPPQGPPAELRARQTDWAVSHEYPIEQSSLLVHVEGFCPRGRHTFEVFPQRNERQLVVESSSAQG